MSRFGEHAPVTVIALVMACSGCERNETSVTHRFWETGTSRTANAYCGKDPGAATAGKMCPRKIPGTAEDGRRVTFYTQDTVPCDRAQTAVLAHR